MKYKTQNKEEIIIVHPLDIVEGVDAMMKYAELIDIMSMSNGYVNKAVVQVYRQVIQEVYKSLNIPLPELNFQEIKELTELFFVEWQNFFQASESKTEEKQEEKTQETQEEKEQVVA